MIRRTKTKLKLKWLGPELNNNYNYNELLNENLSDYNRQVQAETQESPDESMQEKRRRPLL